MDTKKIEIPVMAELKARNEQPEYLFWVGCVGAFDDRYKIVTRAFIKILTHLKVSYAVLGKEESCTGDPARRAGNEMLYQMQALQNIELLNGYGVKKILTICPHCYNILKNEYPDLGGHYEVINYLQFLDQKISEGSLTIDPAILRDQVITYHDPCYLGRANDIYFEPRSILKKLSSRIVEMKRHKNVAFQMIATLAAHQGADYEMARRAIQAMVDMVKAQISDFDPKSIDVEKLLTSPGKENLRALIDKAAASEGFPYLVKQIVQERNSKLRKVVGLDAVGMELIEMPHGEESVVHQDDTGRWMEEKDTGRVTVRQAGKIAVVASNKRPLLTDYEEGELLTPEGRAAHPGKHKAFALISANVAQHGRRIQLP